MERNLELLEKHRQKMGFLIALIIFMFVYSCVIIFWITSVSFWQKNEDEKLLLRFERVKSIILTREVIFDTGSEDLRKIVSGILENTEVTDFNGVSLSSFPDKLDFSLPLNSIIYKDGFKYYHTLIDDKGQSYNIILRDPAENYGKIHLIFILFLIILTPILYSLLAFIGCRLMHYVYKPIKDMIINLEGFATNINHEFKTSLSEVLSSLELAQITGDYKDGVQSAVGSAKRLNNILDSLGIIIRFVNSDYRKEKVNIITLLNESITDYQNEIQKKGIHIIKKYSVNSPVFTYIDREPLLLCFTNILKNAIRYSHEGGRIELYIYKNKFIIKDFGVGIEEKNIEKIFERYFRENYAGTGSGIGLSLVKRIAERYGWNISVKSEKNTFTEFVLEFQ